MDGRLREVIRIGDAMFSSRGEVNSLWQEIARHFYPERADFTDRRNEGDEYSDHLFSSIPILARRELGNLLSANMRPQSQKWFSIHVEDIDLDDRDRERQFLEYLTDIQWRLMYDARAGFVRATKQGDHDFACFGNAVIRVGLNSAGTGLHYRNYHLRDCAWSENADGVVDCLYRNWSPTARQLREAFGSAVSKQVSELAGKNPERAVKCRHIVVPSRLYQYESQRGKKKFPFSSIYVETETQNVLEETGLSHFPYVVPRWQTVSGSVYGRSMATGIALPDGRTIQVVVRTLREAGEKYVDAPMIAVGDAIRSDIALFAGGITTVDADYDERLGEVLRPISQNKGSMPVGFEIAEALRQDISHAFFLDKIQLPEPQVRDMTAYEVRRRVEEHIRAASPLFEPVQHDYNHPLCETTFRVLMENGAFPIDQMPESLEGRDVDFTFRSPLSDMADQSEAATFVDVMQRIIMPMAELDPAQVENVNLTASTRAAMKAAGWKQEWFNPVEVVEQKREEMRQAQEAMKAMAAAQQVGATVEQAGAGGKAVAEAMGMQEPRSR